MNGRSGANNTDIKMPKRAAVEHNFGKTPGMSQRRDTLGMTDNITVSGNYITLITHLTLKHAFLQEASFACFIIYNEEQVHTYNRNLGMSSNIVYDMNV